MKVDLSRKGDGEAWRVRSRVCHMLRWMVSLRVWILECLVVGRNVKTWLVASGKHVHTYLDCLHFRLQLSIRAEETV